SYAVERRAITLTINGKDHDLTAKPWRTLVAVIHDDRGQTGYEHGVCGASTVLLDDEPVRSCLMFAVQAVGHRIRNVEDYNNGSGCTLYKKRSCGAMPRSAATGTLGFLMLAASVLEKRPALDNEELVDILSSNLCRCTGYANIIEGVRA